MTFTHLLCTTIWRNKVIHVYKGIGREGLHWNSLCATKCMSFNSEFSHSSRIAPDDINAACDQNVQNGPALYGYFSAHGTKACESNNSRKTRPNISSLELNANTSNQTPHLNCRACKMPGIWTLPWPNQTQTGLPGHWHKIRSSHLSNQALPVSNSAWDLLLSKARFYF